MTMKKIKIGVIGLGQKGFSLMHGFAEMDDVCVVGVCDEYEDRVQNGIEKVKEIAGNTPVGSTDYRDIIAMPELDAVVIATAWEVHIEIAIAAMRAGKYTCMEVGGAYSIEDCWKLVRTYEETGTYCMFLENCCYGQKEMMCLNMAKKGMFGDIVHCDGGYFHDVRDEIITGNEIRHYRLRNYTLRCCDNYPTHALGPICKLLNINRGNRMVSLVSVSSKAAGLREYAAEKRGKDDVLVGARYAQGDIVTTIISCAGGETIRLTLNTTLPRPSTRGLTINGTKGFYQEETNSVYLECDADKYDGRENEWHLDWSKNWDNGQEYMKEYDHPLWKKYQQEGVKAGHGGMDYLIMRAFVESVKAQCEPPIDVYDAASWMSISALSEQSISMGGHPVTIPDFTGGKWIKQREQKLVEEYRLDKIPEI